MSPRARPLVIICALVALAGCGSGGDDSAKSTTTATTPRAADAPKLSAAQSRRAAGQMLDDWSTQITSTAKAITAREQAGAKGLRDAYFKADGRLQGLLKKLDLFPAQAGRESARYVPATLARAIQADADAWKQWGDSIADVRAAADRGQFPDKLAETGVVTHLAAYEAAKRTPPARFREVGRLIPDKG